MPTIPLPLGSQDIGHHALTTGREELWRMKDKLQVQERALGSLAAHLEQVTRELHSHQIATLGAMSAILRTRDGETQEHCQRVTAYALMIGHAMALQDQMLGRLALGAMMHDIGKIGVPDAVLLKPGALDPEEWRIIRGHPETGARILGGLPWLKSTVPVVLHHHERYDGTGYPKGLAKEAIPLEARIFAVADTLDAMTSDRPYRRALTFDRAFEEIMSGIGQQFDPEVVRAFESIAEELRSVEERSCLPSQAADPDLIPDWQVSPWSYQEWASAYSEAHRVSASMWSPDLWDKATSTRMALPQAC